MIHTAQETQAAPSLRRNAAWLLENAPHLKEKEPLAAGGKHAGKQISELLREDPWYCQWIIRAAKDEDASCNMRDMAAWLAENATNLKVHTILAGRCQRL
ncbi:unnamed protein product [Symbiodinium pilosum]|uniref:Uncharacterized protein n=1 Tax=Symbiodinium pilosum TaxID=2952 RepID=A0A812Q0E8_SYMPI|nr:unnamed protein product [Symbiodinium pilosum]